MGKVRLEPGATLDVLTADELAAALTALSGELRSAPVTIFPQEAIQLDANGNGSGNQSLNLYQVPIGWLFTLHRIMIAPDGYTPGNPFTNATGYAEIHARGRMKEFVNFSSTAGGLPASNYWTGAAGIKYMNGERVTVHFFGGPASGDTTSKGVVYVSGQGTLEPLTTD